MQDQKTRETEARREFLKRAGIVAVTVPAVTLLLSANAKAINGETSGQELPIT